MVQVKNLHLLHDMDPGSLEKMEHAATEHKRHGSIVFKIDEYIPQSIIIQAAQGKNAAGVYHTQKRLIEIVHETFDRFFPGRKIKVHAIPYKQPAPAKVDPQWINERMLATGTKLKDISRDTGIDYTQLSALVTGTRPMSLSMKALFYFYFLPKGEKK